MVVLNGERQPHDLSRFTHPPVFSPNSERLACAGVAGSTPLVVVDGAGFRPDHEPIGSALFFSPDSTHLAYMAARGTEQFAVVDKVESEPFGPMRFDEADIVFDSPQEIRYLVMRDWDVLLVRDRILRADGGLDYAEAGHASELSALDRAHPSGSKREPQGEPAWKRWIHALLGLGLGIVVLPLTVTAVLFLIYAEDMHMLIVGLIALLGCLWMLGVCIRLLAGHRADGGLFSANTRRTILWVQRGLAALAVGGSVVRFLLSSS